MPPLAIRAHTATTALGPGRESQLSALRARRGGLRRNDFGDAVLATWIGRVDGLEDALLPPALAQALSASAPVIARAAALISRFIAPFLQSADPTSAPH